MHPPAPGRRLVDDLLPAGRSSRAKTYRPLSDLNVRCFVSNDQSGFSVKSSGVRMLPSFGKGRPESSRLPFLHQRHGLGQVGLRADGLRQRHARTRLLRRSGRHQDLPDLRRVIGPPFFDFARP